MELDEKTIETCLNIAKGCHDYNGGHHLEETNQAFHHGIQTVVNCLTSLLQDKNLNDFQLKIVHSIGTQIKK